MTATGARRLNLGCGRDLRPGYLNVDAAAEVRPDLVWDLDRTPYPLPANHYDEILARDVVEHLGSVPAFVEEAYRLLRPGGELEITTPHFSSANSYRDPTHRWHLGYFSFDYFLEGHPLVHYSSARFEIVRRELAFHPTRANRIVGWWARRDVERWERQWCWTFPAWYLLFRLRAVKDAARVGRAGDR